MDAGQIRLERICINPKGEIQGVFRESSHRESVARVLNRCHPWRLDCGEPSLYRTQVIKRVAYQTLPRVQEYVLIEQDFVDVEVCRRSSGWVSTPYFLGDEVWFESVDFKRAVEEVYRLVENEEMAAFLPAREQADQTLAS